LAKKVPFHRYLREARLARGMSVSEVAERVGVTSPCVYFWEMGRTRPRDANLVALCKTLKLPIRATRDMAEA
jgi:transcriptional regulator with XRE-family HTH domain